MSGNVCEWEDSCVSDNCIVRSSSFKTPAKDTGCSEAHYALTARTYTDVGIRCCKDVDP